MKTYKHESGHEFQYTYDSDMDCLEVFKDGTELGAWVCMEAGPIEQLNSIADIYAKGFKDGQGNE